MSVKPPVSSLVRSAPPALQPRPLGNADLQLAQRVVAGTSLDWSVELHGICDDQASLIVVPQDGDDAIGPTFAITRDACGLRLDQLHWDELTEIGLFASLHDALDATVNLLGAWTGCGLPTTVTIH